MTAHEITALFHAGLGTIALATFWMAALARKGSVPHRYAGRVYGLAMLGLLVPAVPLSVGVLDKDAAFGWFLFYLVLITFTALWQGWFALRHKRDFARFAGPGLRNLAWANIAAGAAVLGLGVALKQPIFLGFSLIGLLGGRGMLALIRRGPEHPRWWMGVHLGAMFGCGVATHIAFLSIGLPRLLPMLSGQTLQLLAWMGPLAVASAARIWVGRKYLPRQSSASTISPVSTVAR